MPEFTTVEALLKELMRREGMTAAELAEKAGVKLRTLNSYLQGERSMPPKVGAELFIAVGWTEKAYWNATAAMSMSSGFHLPPTSERSWNAVHERAGATYGSQAAQDLPTPARLRQLEIERELVEAGATEQQVSDFRRSVRESPLIGVLFHGGAPNRISEEAAMQLYEGVAIGFKAIVEQLLQEEREAKRRT